VDTLAACHVDAGLAVPLDAVYVADPYALDASRFVAASGTDDSAK
jgi:hypothetical protein